MTRFAPILFALSILLPIAAAAQTVYKSTGPDGKVTYTDKAAPDSSPVKLHVDKPSALSPSASSSNGNLAGLTMFVTPACTFCKSARKYMNDKHIAFSEIDITTKDGGAIARQLKIGSAVPVFVYKDKRVLGFTPAKLEALLKT
jgi:glutaredoxin